MGGYRPLGETRRDSHVFAWGTFLTLVGLHRVFKPKDEEPYGRLNPKVCLLQSRIFGHPAEAWLGPLRRRPSGYTERYEGCGLRPSMSSLLRSSNGSSPLVEAA